MIARALQRPDQFVQLEVHGLGVTVLCVLNKEDHEERNDGRASIDDELPGVLVVEHWPDGGPHDNDEEGNDERPGAAKDAG